MILLLWPSVEDKDALNSCSGLVLILAVLSLSQASVVFLCVVMLHS